MHYSIHQVSPTKWELRAGDGTVVASFDDALGRTGYDLACIALSAEQVGAARRALELTVAYTKVRVQFGQAIGGFQALQHRMADLHVQVESARSLSYAVASAAADAAPGLGLRAAAAKVYCSELALRVAGEMIQLHGAIGITTEYPLHRFTTPAWSWREEYGSDRHWSATLAAGYPGDLWPALASAD